MQVNSFGTVKLIFKDEYKLSISLLSKVNSSAVGMYNIMHPTEYHIKRRGMPVAFVWNHTHSIKFSPKLVNWIINDFKPLFDYDPMLWLASVGTAPVELREYLIQHPSTKEF